MRLAAGIRVGGVIAVLAAAGAIFFCPVPWSGALFAGAVLLVLFSRLARRKETIPLMVNIAAIVAALAIFEAYLGIERLKGDGTHVEGSIRDGWTHSDDVLGYAPKAGVRVTIRKYDRETLLYSATYTIAPDGLRVAPPAIEGPSSGCVVFFGDSITFGEGVNDDETFPYQVGVKAGGHLNIYNFAFGGYGPHQMLANLQAGRLDRIVSCTPTHFIYFAIPDHIARVAGRASWDRHGPRYELLASGAVIRNGNFDDPPHLIGRIALPRLLMRVLDRSFTWSRFFGIDRNPDDGELELFVAIVRESARLIEERYRGSQFRVILDDRPEMFSRIRLGAVEPMEAQLEAAGIPVLKLTSIIPDLAVNWPRYVLSAKDRHPNPLEHELIADYIVNQIILRH